MIETRKPEQAEHNIAGSRDGNGASIVGRLLRSRRGRVLLFAGVIALGGIGVVARMIWLHVRDHVAARDDYRLTAADISITPPPPWIHANVRAEVIHNALSGASLSILDDGLVERIHSVFSLHPWVAKVQRVTKSHPAHVEVELVYRRPVAMVEVPGGWYPVDADGVLLPIDDFSPADARSYPLLSGIESSPIGGAGVEWGDVVVLGGAKIAESLGPLWSEFGLRKIRWAKPAAGSDSTAPAQFQLLTAGGNAILWGAAPASETTGEPTAQQKIVRLKMYIAGHGSLDDPQGGPRDLDLRHSDPGARTAARPSSP
jgi:hypothetical protein